MLLLASTPRAVVGAAFRKRDPARRRKCGGAVMSTQCVMPGKSPNDQRLKENSAPDAYREIPPALGMFIGLGSR
jgi:hypothetical protein